jgi:serine/threonine-protein kinase
MGENEGQGDHAWPDLLPGGRKLLFSKWGNTPASDSIAVMDLESLEHRTVAVGVNAQYLQPGWILLGSSDGTLSVAPFDPTGGQITGPFRALAGDVRGVQSGARDFAVSASGTLAYLTGAADRGTPAWVDRDGESTPIEEDWEGDFTSMALSPDGTRAAVALQTEGRVDIWVRRVDEVGSPPQRITFREGDVQRPVWLPGGDTVAYIGSRPETGVTELLARPWDGTGEHRVILEQDRIGTGKVLQEADISRDGRWVAYRVGGGVGTRDIYLVDLAGDSAGRPLIADSFNEHSPDISPDGRFIAYGSNESGRDEVYVRTFPDVSGGKWLISTRGAREPVWSPDGRTVYYRELSGSLVGARWDAEGSGGVLSREVFFPASDYYSDPVHAVYTMHPDGERFLMLELLELGSSHIVWIEDFASGLEGAGTDR